MKIFKLLFSRTILLILLILIQVAAITFIVLVGLEIPYVNSVVFACLTILEIVFLITVLVTNNQPDLKIPWIVFILAIPILGILSYMFFANHGLKKSVEKKGTEILYKIAPYIVAKEGWENRLKEEKPSYVGIYKYLESVQGTQGYEHNKVTYFSSGEEFFPDLINKLNEAEKFILMEFFIVDYGKEWSKIEEVLFRKAKEGVKIKFLYDDFGCASTLKRSFLKKMRENGIDCHSFNRFRPVLSGIFNNRDHRKICVIDHKYGYTGGINLADEYANEKLRFGYWKDSMIRIEGEAIKNLMGLFFVTFDCISNSLSNYEEYFVGDDYAKEGDSFVMPFGDGPKPYNNEYIGEQTFINLFSVAKKSITISSPYLIPTYSLTQALRNAAYRGIDVKLIVPGIPDKKMVYLMAKNNFKPLLEAGVKIYVFKPGFNHEKAVVVDNEIAFIGTINLDYRSLIHHFECGAILYRSEAINDMTNSLNETVEKSQIVASDFKLSWIKKLFCNIISLFAPLL